MLDTFLLLGGLLLIYLYLTFIILETENTEDVFYDTIHWQEIIIQLGDEIIIETKEGAKEGFFRGLVGGKQWIFRLSCEGNPRVEYCWQDILSIKKLN